MVESGVETRRHNDTMKMYLNSLNLRLTVWMPTLVSLLIALTAQADTNEPAASAGVSVIARGSFGAAPGNSTFGVPLGTSYYEVDFPGGRTGEFFNFWRTNGFADDSVLFAGDVKRVYIPRFKIKDARLSEVAKSIEFVTEGRLSIEVVEKKERHQGNLWRVKLADAASPSQVKTRACALPALFSGSNPKGRIEEIAQQVYRTLFEGTFEITHNEARRPQGSFRILESEKIVVAVGTEAYVEAIASALEAAEKVAEIEAVEKSKSQ